MIFTLLADPALLLTHSSFEGWPIIDSLYFAVVTFTTIGYGDIAPQTLAGKLFTTVFAVLGFCILGIALGVVGSKMVEAELNAVGNAQHGVATKESFFGHFFSPT